MQVATTRKNRKKNPVSRLAHIFQSNSFFLKHTQKNTHIHTHTPLLFPYSSRLVSSASALPLSFLFLFLLPSLILLTSAAMTLHDAGQRKPLPKQGQRTKPTKRRYANWRAFSVTFERLGCVGEFGTHHNGIELKATQERRDGQVIALSASPSSVSLWQRRSEWIKQMRGPHTAPTPSLEYASDATHHSTPYYLYS